MAWDNPMSEYFEWYPVRGMSEDVHRMCLSKLCEMRNKGKILLWGDHIRDDGSFQEKYVITPLPKQESAGVNNWL